MNRITFSQSIVKRFEQELQKAYSRGDHRLVRRISVLLATNRQESWAGIANQWGVVPANYLQLDGSLFGEKLGQSELSVCARSPASFDQNPERGTVRLGQGRPRKLRLCLWVLDDPDDPGPDLEKVWCALQSFLRE